MESMVFASFLSLGDISITIAQTPTGGQDRAVRTGMNTILTSFINFRSSIKGNQYETHSVLWLFEERLLEPPEVWRDEVRS